MQPVSEMLVKNDRKLIPVVSGNAWTPPFLKQRQKKKQTSIDHTQQGIGQRIRCGKFGKFHADELPSEEA
jgi:hypothetical protein